MPGRSVTARGAAFLIAGTLALAGCTSDPEPVGRSTSTSPSAGGTTAAPPPSPPSPETPTSPDPPSSPEPPATPEDADAAHTVVLTYVAFNGWYAGRPLPLPTVTVTADGTVYLAGPADDPAPIQEVSTHQLSAAAVDTLLDEAAARGLRPGADPGRPEGVYDAPSYSIAFGPWSPDSAVRGYALDEEYDRYGITEAQAEVREALRETIGDLMDLLPPGSGYLPGKGRSFRPTEVMVERVKPESSQVGTAGVAWPDAPYPPRPRGRQYRTCVTLTGADLAGLRAGLDGATQTTSWLFPDGKSPSTAALRPVIPGDRGCTAA